MMSSTDSRHATRDLILRALKASSGTTVLELAKRVEVSPVTVRHHLSSLQADGLVEAQVERRSVGRPHHVFFLTDAGEELFPRQYLSLTKRLLHRLKANLPSEMVAELFEQIAHEIVTEHAGKLKGKNNAERMAVLIEILEAEGFMVNWKQKNGEFQIIEHNCPYRKLGLEHPDICKLDQALITAILDAPAEKRSCQLKGDPRCVYIVKSPPAENPA